MTEIKTLLDAVKYFADFDVTFNYMLGIKWPDGKPLCPKCGSDKIGLIQSRHMLQCKNPDCRKQFSVKVGTIFEDSPLGLDRWFVAVWCIANDKNGISSCELARAIGVTQKSAWHMLHRIRTAMFTKTFLKMKNKPVPKGLEKFDGLLSKLAKVPKEELNAKLTKQNKKRGSR